jgi:hypothetical protein
MIVLKPSANTILFSSIWKSIFDKILEIENNIDVYGFIANFFRTENGAENCSVIQTA